MFNELNLLRNFNFSNQTFNSGLKPLTIVRFGTSGCIQRDIPVDSFVASAFGVGIDNVLHFYNFKNSAEETELRERFKMHCYFHHTIHPYTFKANENLLNKIGADFIKGITLTAPGFYAPQGRQIGFSVSHPQFYDDLRTFIHSGNRITNIEMETAAMYGLSSVLNHHCLSLNVLLANRATGAFSVDPKAATEKLIEHGLNFIAGL